MTIAELITESMETAREKGWADDRTFGDHIALIHSELSEALEEFRKGRRYDEVYYSEGGKPEGIPIELADAIIRVAMLCGLRGIDIEEAIKVKNAFNKTRPFRHGGKVI